MCLQEITGESLKQKLSISQFLNEETVRGSPSLDPGERDPGPVPALRLSLGCPLPTILEEGLRILS